uniref:hypothetical protein n=1 Tax=Streptomyces sp. S501 TaxID=2420135 RepID=UPI001F0F0EC8|nr:hypothetical protein [Streptomyces sp. S501]
MSEREWQALTKSEEAFMVNSYEIDILAGVWGDLPDLLRSAFLVRDVLAHMRRQLLRVRDAPLAKAEVLPDLYAVVVDGAARLVVGLQLRDGNLYLPGDELHDLTGQLWPVPGKLAVPRVELQQHDEAQSRRTMLSGHEWPARGGQVEPGTNLRVLALDHNRE